MKIYLAGRVNDHDWRAPILGKGFYEFCRLHWHPSKSWPVLHSALPRGHHYTGPFTLGDHCGAWRHGDGYYQGSDFVRRQLIVGNCFASIERSDLVIAWLEDDAAHGTLVEIGYAEGRGIPVIVGTPASRENYVPWFATSCGFYNESRYGSARELFDLVADDLGHSDSDLSRTIVERQREHARVSAVAAPPPDPGSVYFVQAGTAGPIKIGFSDRPERRLSQLQTSHAERLRILATIPGGKRLESNLHQRFARHRMQGEWFKPAQEVLDFVASQIAGTPR